MLTQVKKKNIQRPLTESPLPLCLTVSVKLSMLETAFIFKLDEQASAFQQPASLAFLFCLCRQFVRLNAVYQPA